MDYSEKSYGRNEEISYLFSQFDSDRDISMHGPRRLGKTFVLDRLVDVSAERGWTAVKADLAGCTSGQAVFRELCARLGGARSGGESAKLWFTQALGQLREPKPSTDGPWYQPYVTLDHETYFERLVEAMHTDRRRRWVLLIDELPIFLKALHDKGPDGIAAARDFMNLTNRLRERYRRVRWMVTGSIGIGPLAREGQYLGAMAKFQNFELRPLDEKQAADYVKDLATEGRLPHRRKISDPEAQALVRAVGWRAA